MLSGLRNFVRGVVAVGRENRELREDMARIRSEWDDELSEMRTMWDKLQLWAARQAKRDKAITQTHVEALTGNDGGGQGMAPNVPAAAMTKTELRAYAATLKSGVPR